MTPKHIWGTLWFKEMRGMGLIFVPQASRAKVLKHKELEKRMTRLDNKHQGKLKKNMICKAQVLRTLFCFTESC